MQLKINQVFEYQDSNYIKYFILKKYVNNIWYVIKLDEEFNIIDYNNYSEEELNNTNCFKLAEKTLDTVYDGDILIGYSGYCKILGRVGNMVFTTCSYETIRELEDKNSLEKFYSIQELKDKGFKFYQEEGKEYSMDEVAKALNIDVKDLKIKKE